MFILKHLLEAVVFNSVIISFLQFLVKFTILPPDFVMSTNQGYMAIFLITLGFLLLFKDIVASKQLGFLNFLDEFQTLSPCRFKKSFIHEYSKKILVHLMIVS